METEQLLAKIKDYEATNAKLREQILRLHMATADRYEDVRRENYELRDELRQYTGKVMGGNADVPMCGKGLHFMVNANVLKQTEKGKERRRCRQCKRDSTNNWAAANRDKQRASNRESQRKRRANE